MTNEQLLKFCEEQPEAADSLIVALCRTIRFHETRGAMLRSLWAQPRIRSNIIHIKDYRKS